MKIIFISHEASLTGAPIILLYLLDWISKNRKQYSVDVLLLDGGDIENEFRALAGNLYRMNDTRQNSFKKALAKVGFRVRNKRKEKNRLIKRLTNNGYDVIYANTAVTIPFATELKESCNVQPALIAHIHEMRIGLRKYVKNPEKLVPAIDFFISASNAVSASIVDLWAVDQRKIKRVYEFSRARDVSQSLIRKHESFVVGGSGTVFWRKGYDIFIQVARYLKKFYPEKNISFVWVGFVNENDALMIEEELRKLELSDSVKFVGVQKQPFAYYEYFDVFVLPSREDPFPLVCIEVGALGKPIICFDGATGTSEVLGSGGGTSVPYLDIEEMASAIMKYYDDADLLATDGRKAKEVFSEFTPEKMCPEINQIIERYI